MSLVLLKCLRTEYVGIYLEHVTHNIIIKLSITKYFRFDIWTLSFSTRCTRSFSCINEYLGIDGRGNVGDLVFAYNYSVARMLPREVELVSE